jgi:hypothetical protein
VLLQNSTRDLWSVTYLCLGTVVHVDCFNAIITNASSTNHHKGGATRHNPKPRWAADPWPQRQIRWMHDQV